MAKYRVTPRVEDDLKNIGRHTRRTRHLPDSPETHAPHHRCRVRRVSRVGVEFITPVSGGAITPFGIRPNNISVGEKFYVFYKGSAPRISQPEATGFPARAVRPVKSVLLPTATS